MTHPLPLPATPEAWVMGCLCERIRLVCSDCSSAVIHPDCPLHSESARAAAAICDNGECDRAQPFRGRPVL